MGWLILCYVLLIKVVPGFEDGPKTGWRQVYFARVKNATVDPDVDKHENDRESMRMDIREQQTESQEVKVLNMSDL